MKARSITILFIADIIGDPGIELTQRLLKKLVSKYAIDLVIANGENASSGKGITKKTADLLFDIGINVITSGNHFWDKCGFNTRLKINKNILRPANYPSENIGNGYTIYEIMYGYRIAVINLQGRTYMYPIDCPFKSADYLIEKVKNDANAIIIDFHAEATAEKQALAHYLDGKVSAVIGTHTHVQTSDEVILPNGTAYITDAGMTGPTDSVIGIKKEIAIKRFIHQTPFRFEVANGNCQFNGMTVEIDCKTGKAVAVNRIFLTED